MSKKKRQGHYCRICHTYRANEKFSGKGHRQHICKSCSKRLKQQKREKKRANKKALEAGLRPLKYDYPKTAREAASCQQLDIQPSHTDDDEYNATPLYDIDAMIAVYQVGEAHSDTEEPKK